MKNPQELSLRELLYWDTVSTETLADCEVFMVRQTLAASKCSQKKHARFHTISCFPWVNIIALTREKQVVLVEQFRHGIRELTLEIPGGCIESSDCEPLEAAIRELREETGFISSKWSSLGVNHPNPALQDNLCYTFLAEEAEQVEEPSFDNSGTERIRTICLPIAEVEELICQGKITHSLVIAAFHYLLLKRPELRSAAIT